MVKTETKIIQVPREELSIEELRGLSRTAKDSYIERFILKILELNKETGLSSRDLHSKMNYLSMPTLHKYLEGLIAKRQIYKVRTGTSVNYFPNHRPLHPLVNKTIKVDDTKKYKFQLVEIENDLNVYLQEIERDFIGREDVKGGILIPLRGLKVITEYLAHLGEERPKLIEELRKFTEIRKKQNLNRLLPLAEKQEGGGWM